VGGGEPITRRKREECANGSNRAGAPQPYTPSFAPPNHHQRRSLSGRFFKMIPLTGVDKERAMVSRLFLALEVLGEPTPLAFLKSPHSGLGGSTSLSQPLWIANLLHPTPPYPAKPFHHHHAGHVSVRGALEGAGAPAAVRHAGPITGLAGERGGGWGSSGWGWV